jgi:hypothetical protein
LFGGGMVQSATDGSSPHGQERQMKKRERPHIRGMERTKGELGWKIKGVRMWQIGRIRPERRSQIGELGDGGQEWSSHCH